jgi:hypothetical protein
MIDPLQKETDILSQILKPLIQTVYESFMDFLVLKTGAEDFK